MNCDIYVIDTFSDVFPTGIGRVYYEPVSHEYETINAATIRGASPYDRRLPDEWWDDFGNRTYTGTTLEGKSYTINIKNDVAYDSHSYPISWFLKKTSQEITENSITINFEVQEYMKIVSDSFGMGVDIIKMINYSGITAYENVTIPANSFKSFAYQTPLKANDAPSRVIAITGIYTSAQHLLIGRHLLDTYDKYIECDFELYNPTNASITTDITLEYLYIDR